MRVFIIFLAVMTFGSVAKAQNLQLSQSPVLIDSISVTEMISFLQEVEFEATLSQEFGEGQDSIKIIEALADGGTFYFALRQCTGPGIAAQCQLVEPFGYFNGSGVTLSQVNAFNLTKSSTSLAGLIPDGRGILSSKIWLTEGVTASHFGFLVAMFFVDIDAMLSAISPGTIASINYKQEPGFGAGTAGNDFRRATDIDWKVNSVGHNAPDFMNDRIRALVEGVGIE